MRPTAVPSHLDRNPDLGGPSAATDRAARRRRGSRLALIRGVHSAVFLVELVSILWLVVTGLAGRRDRTVAVAAVLVAGEAAVFLANDGVCPLTPLAERHGAASGSVSDIFLPDAIARTIPLWSTALVAVAVVLHGRSLVRQSMSGRSPAR